MGLAFDNSCVIVIAVFVAMLIVGLLVFKDYGMSTDEWIERVSSRISYRSAMRVLTGREVFPAAGPPLSEWQDRYYGVTMQLPLAFAEDMFQLATGTEMPSRTVYLMRHLYTFLVYWLALICFTGSISVCSIIGGLRSPAFSWCFCSDVSLRILSIILRI